MTPVGNPTPGGPAATLRVGDLNGDTKLTVADAILVLKASVGVDVTPEQRLAADLNGDGKVNIQDAQLLLRKAIGI